MEVIATPLEMCEGIYFFTFQQDVLVRPSNLCHYNTQKVVSLKHHLFSLIMSKIKYGYIFYVLSICCVVLLLGFILLKEYINNNLFGDNQIINRTEFRDKNNYNIEINYPKLRNRKMADQKG